MKRIIICLLFIAVGCKREYAPIPHDVIPMDKMKDVIAEMTIADAVATTKSQQGMDEKLLTREYYKQIYKNYGVTQEEYLKSFHFYEGNPKLFNKMYEEVLSEISRQEDSISRNAK